MKDDLGMAMAVGRQMNPLPPIEQYNVYTNNAYTTSKQLPIKDLNNSSARQFNSVEMKSGFAAAPKRERDAMVANLFAAKKSMKHEPVQVSGNRSFYN